QLPDLVITVVVHEEAAQVNEVLSSYLGTLEPHGWAAFAGAYGDDARPTPYWPATASVPPYEYAALVEASSSDVAAAYVGNNAGTITYVESPYAAFDRLPCASMENASGAWVQPNNLGDGQALSHASFQPDGRADLKP